MAYSDHFKNPKVTMTNLDNYHRATSVLPYHHPVVEGDCTKSGDKECSFRHISITENVYNDHNDFTELTRFMVSAKEQKSKLKSRQFLRYTAGELDADYDTYDKGKNRCEEINQISLDLALGLADSHTLDRYKKSGAKFQNVAEEQTINGGLWIIEPLKYTVDSKNPRQLDVSSYASIMGDDFPVADFAGIHFCKLMSPFRALEWIYIDSQYDKIDIEGLQEKNTFFSLLEEINLIQ